MSVNLTLRALQPGTSLEHDNQHIVPVDALTALGWCKDPLGRALIKMRLGHVDASVIAEKGPLMQWLAWECGRKRWAFRDVDQMRNFGMQCASELLGEKCPTCKGRDHRITRNGVVVSCDVCGGTGRMRDMQTVRARAIGLARETVSRVWGDRFDWIIGELAIMERRAWAGEKRIFED